ncbi:MAG: hypothetical protein A3D92_06830 [Bacteroidetes bacterium RIFCSPHIGHO2_02_FULL_44_7]|nr:MAG: hypothetical protein A3D92_06830 [Bacteroidetes bacterium RIFCSPHIGHO2_02_FULL_44_7]
MLKSKQNQRNLFTFVKLILFVGVLGIIYWQIDHFDAGAWDAFHLVRPLSLILALLLVVLNIWLAYLKWKISLQIVAPGTATKTAVHSFFAGLVTGMLTPNMIGNFIGRFYYFERKKRSSIILFTLLCNYTQFLASLTFGWVAILFVGDLVLIPMNKSLLIWLGVGLIFAYLLFFFIDNFLHRIRPKTYLAKFRLLLRSNRSYRSKILGLALLRFLVFTTQFSLVLHAFGESISWLSVMAIWQVYLLTMLVPSLVLGKVGVKESIALFVLGGIGMNEFGVLFSSLIIWSVNSLSPALLGLLICKRRVHVIA